jgi:hypothetical protein
LADGTPVLVLVWPFGHSCAVSFAVAGEGADVDVDLVLVVDVDLDGDGDLAWTPKAGTAHTILVSIATTPSSRRIPRS